MKTKLETKGPTKKVVEVELPPEVVTRKLEEVYRHAAREVVIPGFRPGRAPRALLEARFGRDLFYQDSQRELIQEYLPQALKELELRPVASPQTKVLQFEEGKPFIFQVEVEVLPEVEIEDYLGLEVEADPKPEVTQEAVQEELDRLRREHAVLVPKEGKAEPGDVAVVSERVLDPRGRMLRETRGVEWEVEEDDPLRGKGVGEEAEFALSGEERALLRIEELKRVELPPLDEEFAKELGYESLEELRAKVEQDLQERLEQEHERRLKLKLLDELVDRTPIVLPERVVEDSLREDLESLKEDGLPLPEEETLAEERRRRERALKRELVLQAIKRREGLELSDEEFGEALAEEAERRGLPPAKLKGLLEREGRLGEFRRNLENERALEFIYKHARIKVRSSQEGRAGDERI